MPQLSTALCIVAHLDDELYTGGLLARLATYGVGVHLLCLTRGEHGARGMPPIAHEADLGSIRSQEMACAARVLGVVDLVFLDYIDRLDEQGGMTEPDHDPQQLLAELHAHLDRVAPQLVVTHGSGGEYGHPAHKLLHRLVKQAVGEREEEMLLYTFLAAFDRQPYPDEVNADDPAHLLLDVSAYQESHLLPMLECHWTQASWWAHMRSQKRGRAVSIREAWRRRPQEGIHRHWPPLVPTARPDDLLTDWLEDAGTGDRVLRER